ncbi:MAG: dephospho-CoA kinase [Candidatus Margulisbacteria bacterium]|nr:dephospho-CoA kinase [Candidatus Margulisiibacteriota bacterium]MBU1617462.1 dephospho-CoA kinase [Candidatus Margulisiibacteriota bacterium]MBU1867477.1 dephospho-CoA kinase [Candidatus Margulisiibacteriota bacterium]
MIRKSNNSRIKIIGLTGPIGAGKNEVAKLLKRRGACVIDADLLAHELYKKNYRLWQSLVKNFGSGILKRGGAIERRRLGEIVFNDPKKLKQLNKIVHPYLKEAILKEITSYKSSVVSRKLLVINAAVLKEIGLIPVVDEVWVVTANQNIRLKRLISKGISNQVAEKMIKAQKTETEYLKMADFIVKNEGSLADLKVQLQNQP